MKNLLYLLLFPFVLSSQSLPNKKKIDSLLFQLTTKISDTSRANLYYDICQEYRRKNLDTFSYYNDKLFKLSDRINYQKGIGLYYYNLTFINESLGKDRIASAEKAAAIFFDLKEIKYYLLLQYHLSFAYMSVSQYEDAKKVLNESLPIATKSSYTNETAYLYELFGLISYYEDSLHTSLKYYKKALSYYNLDKENPEKKSQLFLYIAFSHTDLENYAEAIKYLDLANSTGETIDINIEKAVVLNKMHSYDEALKILLSNRRATLYKPKHINDYNTFVLADTYYNLEQYETAIKTLKEISVNEKFVEFTIQYYNLLGKCHAKVSLFYEAKIYNEKALNLVDSSAISNLKQAVYLSKSEIEEALGNTKISLSYYKKYHEAKERNEVKNNAQKIQELQVEFDVIEKNNKIKSLQLAQLQKELKITKQRNFIIFISIALIIASFSVFSFIKINRASKRKNRIIEIKNIKLNTAQKRTQQSLEEKEILLKEIHHRVKNNMQLVISLLKIQSKASNDLQIESFILASENRIHSMALIHEYLYESENFSYVNFEEYVKKLILTIQAMYEGFKEVSITTTLSKIKLDIQTAVSLGLIINELIINAYKYAFTDCDTGTIEIQLFPKDDNYYLILNDDGIGIGNETEIEQCSGLQIVDLLVTQLKGSMKIKNDAGTKISLTFKKSKIISS